MGTKRTVLQTRCQYEQYEVYMRAIHAAGAWLVTESRSHNHEPPLSAATHVTHRRLRVEKTDLIILATGDCSLKRSRIFETAEGEESR